MKMSYALTKQQKRRGVVEIIDTIKEYLVSLGFDLDKSSFDQVKGSIGEIEKLLSSLASGSVVKFAAAATAMTGFAAAIGAVLYQLTVGVANADLQNELFARRMWMAKDNAIAYKNSLDALGATVQDLYLSPELMGKFIELRKEASAMALPGGFNDAMKGVRSLTFEFQRFKLEASYAVYWVGYYLTKYISGPMFGFRGGLEEINDKIQENMPVWTSKIAQFMAGFVRLGHAAYLAGKEIKHIWDSLGKSTKEVAGITAGLFFMLKRGPIGWIIAGLTTLLLLIEDYYTYSNKGESSLPGLWKWVDQLKESLSDDGTLKEFKDSLEELFSALKDVAKSLGGILDILAQVAGYKDFGKMVIDGIKQSFKELNTVLELTAGLLNTINGYMGGDKDKVNKGKEQSSKGIRGFLENHSWLGGIADTLIRPMIGINYTSATRPQNTNISYTISPIYHIHGASNPQTVAQTVDRTSGNLIRNVTKGVII